MLRKRYKDHKASAKQRGIPFLLTYPQWLSIWTASGHLDGRGRLRDDYCMARLGDQGPYSIDNVKIITVAENCFEQVHPGCQPSAETKAKIGAAMQSAHLRRRRSGLPPTRGEKYRQRSYWDFQDGRGPMEERKLTREEKKLVAMAKRVGR